MLLYSYRAVMENDGFNESGKLSPGELCAKPAFSITARYEYVRMHPDSAALVGHRMPQRAWRSNEMAKSDSHRHLGHLTAARRGVGAARADPSTAAQASALAVGSTAHTGAHALVPVRRAARRVDAG